MGVLFLFVIAVSVSKNNENAYEEAATDSTAVWIDSAAEAPVDTAAADTAAAK